MIHGRGHRRQRDEVLDAIEALLGALRESSQHSQAAVRRAQTIRRLRSHGRSYSEILEHSQMSSAQRMTRMTFEATIEASDRLDRAHVRALRGEGVGIARIASLCGISPEQVAAFADESPA